MRRRGRMALAAIFAWALGAAAPAGTVQLTDGSFHSGTLSLDHGILVRGTPSVKVALNNVLIARFTGEAAPPVVPQGVVLTNGARVAGTFNSLLDGVVQIPSKGLRFPQSAIAWAVYQPFDAALAGGLPGGKTGALLPGGDFFDGSIKAADASSAKVLNPIFGPRVFTAAAKDMHAVILRGTAPQPAAFEVITRDGSRYLALDAGIRDPGAVILRHPHYDGLRVPAAELLEIRAAPSRMVMIAEAKPAHASDSYATRDPGGSMLRLAGHEVLGCSLAGGDKATWRKTFRGGVFYARVAAAGESPSAEKVVFVVEADGRVLHRSAPASAGEPPQWIRCGVPAAESITLRVEGPAGAQGLWADPVVLLR